MTGPVKRILVAEDDFITATTIQFGLESAGFEVRTACNGIEAWRMLQTERFDVFVTDEWMPGMSGSEVCQRLRQQPLLARMPIVMVTAKHLGHELQWLREELGVRALVSKPFSTRALILIVEHCLHNDADVRGIEATAALHQGPTSS
ncbi:MAG: response regulator [Pirellulales bacterium]